MANITDIFTKGKTVSPDVTSSSPEKELTKEQPSLFDSLLKESLGQEDNSQVKTEVSKTTLTNSDNKITQNQIKTENTDIENSEIKSNSTGSLLDRLILEAKGEIKAEDKLLNKTEINSSDEISVIKKDTGLNSKIQTSDLIIEKEQNIENKTDLEINIDEVKDLEDNVLEESVQIKNDSKNSIEKIVQNSEENLKQDEISDNILKEKTNSISIDTIKTNKIDDNIVEKEVDDNLPKIVNKIINNEILDSSKIILDDKSSKEIKNLEVITNIKSSNSEDLINSNLLLTNSEEKTLNDLTLSKEPEKEILANPIILTENLEANQNLINPVVEELNNFDTPISNEVSIDEVLSKETILNNKIENKKSLMDLLIEKNMAKIDSSNIEESLVNLPTEESVSKEFVSNMYLSGQKSLVNNQFLFNKHEALSILKESTSLKDVEKSANILDLGLEDLTVEQNVELDSLTDVKKQDFMNLDKKNILDNLLNEKNIRSDDIKNLITKSVEASAALLDNSLNIAEDTLVNVNSPLSYNIQTKIIGAKQQMAAMMSDIARQMYENYRPPVTVFKINLNPVDLGSISIMMKNDKTNNSMSISMSVSNSSTLDALVDNQNVLRNSLNKTFDENTRFNLDFNSSNQNNSQSSNSQSGQSNQDRRFEKEQIDTQSVLQMQEENRDREENLDYM